MRRVQIAEGVHVNQQETDRAVEARAAIQLARTGFGQVGGGEELGQAVLATLIAHVRQIEHAVNEPQRRGADGGRPGRDEGHMRQRQAHEQQYPVGEQRFAFEDVLIPR